MDKEHARPLLVVEDSDEDFELTCWALRRAGFMRSILRAISVEETLERLRVPSHSAAPPALMLLDINLCDGSGIEVLESIRAEPGYPACPVVIISTSSNPRDQALLYRLGAAGYFVKPLDRETFAEQISIFVKYWFRAVALPEC